MSDQNPKPLAGIRVLDLTQALAGPFSTQILGDLGADIVKIESSDRPDSTRSVPPFVDGYSHYFLSINHGKRSISLNLKEAADKQTFLQLCEKADVVISNYRAGVLASLGLDTETLSAQNPKLIQCLISGFGQTESSFRTKAIYDANVQALSGFMSLTAEPDGPPFRCGVSIGDMIPGLFAIQAITTALYHRERTGKGQVIDVAMFDCMFSMLSYYIPLTQVSDELPVPSGAQHSTVAPMGRFRTADGWLIIAAFTEAFWRKLCVAFNRQDWLDAPRYQTMSSRLENRDALMREMDDVVSRKTKAEWMEILDAHDVPNAPVLNMKEVLNHPLVHQRNLLRPQALPSGGNIYVSRQPVVYGGEVPIVEPAKLAPQLGVDCDAIVSDWLCE